MWHSDTKYVMYVYNRTPTPMFCSSSSKRKRQNYISVMPRFPKYGVRVCDDDQQILTKRKISSVNTLRYSNGAKFSHTYTKRQSEVSFSHKKYTSMIVFFWIQDWKHNKVKIKKIQFWHRVIITRQNAKIHMTRNFGLTPASLPGFLQTVARRSP